MTMTPHYDLTFFRYPLLSQKTVIMIVRMDQDEMFPLLRYDLFYDRKLGRSPTIKLSCRRDDFVIPTTGEFFTKDEVRNG